MPQHRFPYPENALRLVKSVVEDLGGHCDEFLSDDSECVIFFRGQHSPIEYVLPPMVVPRPLENAPYLSDQVIQENIILAGETQGWFHEHTYREVSRNRAASYTIGNQSDDSDCGR